MSKYLTSKKSLLAFSILSGLASANAMAVDTEYQVKSGDIIGVVSDKAPSNTGHSFVIGANNAPHVAGSDLYLKGDGANPYMISGITLGKLGESQQYIYFHGVSGYTGEVGISDSIINIGGDNLETDRTNADQNYVIRNSTINDAGAHEWASSLYVKGDNNAFTLDGVNVNMVDGVKDDSYLIAVLDNNHIAIKDTIFNFKDSGRNAITFNANGPASVAVSKSSIDNSKISGDIRSVSAGKAAVSGGAAATPYAMQVDLAVNKSVLDSNLIADSSGDLSKIANSTINANLSESTLTGNTFLKGPNSFINLSLDNNSKWNVSGDSVLTSLKLQNGGMLNLSGNKVTTSSLSQDAGAATGYINVGDGANGNLLVNGTASGHYHILAKSSGKNPLSGDIDGYAAMGSSKLPTQVVTYLSKSADGKDVSSATFGGAAELGTYKYNAVVLPDASGQSHVQFQNSGELSNSASTALSLAAAPRDIAYQQSETLSKRLDASRRSGDEGGVWASYFGGKSRADLKSGAGYDMDTNGFMLGVDTGFKVDNGSWLAGVAFSSGRSDMTSLNNRADIDSYGAQGYVSRRFDNGIFVDTGVQFSHFTESGKVSMLDGQHAQADTGTNGYGLNVKLGYDYRNASGFFAEPYVKATAMTFDGMNYRLSNGMTVNSAGMNSLQGELGVNAGYTFDLPQKGAFVKPYINLAGVNEFANGNKVTLNETDTLNNSVDGAGVRVGAGVQMQMTQNLGGYVSVDYMNADKTERPWDAVVGVSYTW